MTPTQKIKRQSRAKRRSAMLRPLEVSEVQRRIAAGECVNCRRPTDMDYEAGFPFHKCDKCRKAESKIRPPRPTGLSAKKYAEEHYREGIDNIDRWMGLK